MTPMNPGAHSAHPASIDQLLRDARSRIDPVDAEWLLMHALEVSRTRLFTHGDAPVESTRATRFEALVRRREAGEPVAYLIGRRGFWRFELEVTPDTLIPRPETELLVELALRRIDAEAAAMVADLGTGSGAIALAIAMERPRVQVVATDASTTALEVARRNAAQLRIPNILFAAGDWCDALPNGRFDLIASNPPYIATNDAHLAQGDLRFEPAGALASGADGLDAIRTIVAQARAHLAPDGWLLIEHGLDQGAPVRALFAASGYTRIETARDLEERDRVTLGRMPG